MQIRNYDVYRMFEGSYEQENTCRKKKIELRTDTNTEHMTDIRTEDPSTYLLELAQKQRHRQNTYVCIKTESHIQNT